MEVGKADVEVKVGSEVVILESCGALWDLAENLDCVVDAFLEEQVIDEREAIERCEIIRSFFDEVLDEGLVLLFALGVEDALVSKAVHSWRNEGVVLENADIEHLHQRRTEVLEILEKVLVIVAAEEFAKGLVVAVEQRVGPCDVVEHAFVSEHGEEFNEEVPILKQIVDILESEDVWVEDVLCLDELEHIFLGAFAQ